jgi:hypothetical protein
MKISWSVSEICSRSLWIDPASIQIALGANQIALVLVQLAGSSICRPLKRARNFLGDLIPGLRSLRSLTRGYHLSPPRGLLTLTFQLEHLARRG